MKSKNNENDITFSLTEEEEAEDTGILVREWSFQTSALPGQERARSEIKKFEDSL